MDQPTYDERTMAALQQWIEESGPRLFPAECKIAVQRYDRPDIPLPMPDDDTLHRAVEKRRREFSAGRVAAGTALEKLGVPHQRIPVGPERNPVWPADISGSITHTAGLAIAVVARREKIAALGIDLERADAVKPALWAAILREQEITWLSNFPPEQQVRWATVIFCAKEAFYKLQHPLTGAWADFQAAQVTIRPDTGEFQLVCSESKVTSQLDQTTFSGKYVIRPELALAAMHLNQLETKNFARKISANPAARPAE